ncbi:Lsr2 family protein [Streptomyces sp. NPDC050704]|uniref:histone-like nucleoid-structuring protein Lsr2 n=1 Tax=Streptomyces sp. NPDC050704 TaxID=3157219 RepID=UPI00343D7FFA
MAQKKVITYTDDVTGEESEDITKHTLLLDGAGVEIDLTSESHDRLMEVLRPYLHAKSARRVRGSVSSGGAAPKRSGTAASGSGDTAKIRAWAKENGYEVNDRGRVSAEVRSAYDKANS